MTCHEARELYSALLDEELDPVERAGVESHVAGCPECARELDRFRRTVSLIRAAEPVRAPVGFVDRVLAAAQPVPWYRRLAHRLFWPLRVKLPIEAAAALLVAGAAVYVFQHTPELQQAARQETPAPAPSPAPSARPAPPPASPPARTAPPDNVAAPPAAYSLPAPITTPGSPPPSGPRDQAGASAEVAKRPGPPEPARAAAPPVGAKPAQKPAAASDIVSGGAGSADAKATDGRRADAPSATAETSDRGTIAGKTSEPTFAERRAKEDESRARQATAPGGSRVERRAEPTAPPASDQAARDRVLPSVLSDTPPASSATAEREEKAKAPAAAPPPAEGDSASQGASAGATPGANQAPGSAIGRLQAAPRSRQDAGSRPAAPPTADVAARLAVADPELALRGLSELLARAGGREVSRRPDGAAAAVDVLVPRERYAEFVRGLAQLGRLSLEREAATLPALVRLTLRIGS